MDIGVITDYDLEKESGVITSIDDEKLTFNYRSGQNMMSGDILTTPKLTGKHEQANGYKLKPPQVGDPVIYKRSGLNISVWAYASSFVDLVERQHGKHFR